MRVHSSTRYVALAALAGALACAGNKARTDDGTQPDQAAAARDTTSGRDTLNGQNQNPPGYRGMERDTTAVPNQQQTPTDTFLQRQGTGAPQDTAGYSGMERVDTSAQGQQNQANPSGQSQANPTGQNDSTGMSGMDSTQMQGDSTGARNGAAGAGLDSTGQSKTGDTTGYHPSQQQSQSQDSSTSR
jgi:hypothetical protein